MAIIAMWLIDYHYKPRINGSPAVSNPKMSTLHRYFKRADLVSVGNPQPSQPRYRIFLLILLIKY